MSRRKLSAADYRQLQLQKGQVVRCYPAGSDRAQLRMQGPPRAQRKGDDDVAPSPGLARAGVRSRAEA